MKKIIILPLLLVFTNLSYSQQIIQKQSLTKADYLQKSKKQKTVAWILLGEALALSQLLPPSPVR